MNYSANVDIDSPWIYQNEEDNIFNLINELLNNKYF